MPVTPLSQLPVGTHVRLKSVDGGKGLMRKLLALGISPGNEFEIMNHRGSGIVLGRGGNRVALGASISSKLQVEVINA